MIFPDARPARRLALGVACPSLVAGCQEPDRRRVVTAGRLPGADQGFAEELVGNTSSRLEQKYRRDQATSRPCGVARDALRLHRRP